MLPAFLFGFTASFISTYLISFDRLLSVLFPMWYTKREKSKKGYLISMLFCIIFCHSFIAYSGYQIIFTVSETNKVICAPHECFWGWASDLVYVMFSFFYVLTFINYVIIWIMLRWTAKNNQNQGEYLVF
uniref:Uncharacterized protein n=1 Tax=Meloidogyne enterolobii TaxID=390850 RepID=A0A6V7Y9U8_MELEN|nr:unnamed protein product [Meloidogyne enterolobii]